MENIKLKGATYSNVPSVTLPTDLGGTANFIAESNLLQFGVLRPDAELIQTYTNDTMLVADEGVTLPSYSTTGSTLVATSNLSPTITANHTDYSYYVLVRGITIPSYSVTTIAKGREEYACMSYLYEIARVPDNTFKALIDSTTYSSINLAAAGMGYIRDVYFSSATALGIYTSTSYGIHQVGQAPTVSSSKITIRRPTVYIRGHTTYFTSTFYNALTDVRLQYRIEVYRASRSSLNYEGWGSEQQMLHILDDINNNNQNLT